MFNAQNIQTPQTQAELKAWLRLCETPGIGAAAARLLLATFGLPENVLAQSQMALSRVLTQAQIQALHTESQAFEALWQQTLAWLSVTTDTAGERAIISLGDTHYPTALLACADPPLLLYVLGQAPHQLAKQTKTMAMVGSRNPSHYGTSNAQAFARNFAQAGWVVVSGLAAGVDAAAHEGALAGCQVDAHHATWAVVGTGLDRVYPKSNLALAQAIAQRGLIISEFAIGTPAMPNHFPRRNRLIAALSQGVVVVEAATQSGSLITARVGAEMGKEVFAIPGSIHSPQSKGCHLLLRQGAKLVETAQDILEELRSEFRSAPEPQEPRLAKAQKKQHAIKSTQDTSLHARQMALVESDGEDDPVLQALGYEPMGFDDLQQRCGLDTATLQAQLLDLELQGQVLRLAGGLLQRSARA